MNRRQKFVAAWLLFSITFALTSILLIATIQNYQHRHQPGDKYTHQLTARKAH